MGGGDRRWGDGGDVGGAVTWHRGCCNRHGDVVVAGGGRRHEGSGLYARGDGGVGKSQESWE